MVLERLTRQLSSWKLTSSKEVKTNKGEVETALQVIVQSSGGPGIRHVKRLGASNVFLMLGSNLVQAAAGITQFDPTIRLRYKNQRKKEGAPSRLTCRIKNNSNIVRNSATRQRVSSALNVYCTGPSYSQQEYIEEGIY